MFIRVHPWLYVCPGEPAKLVDQIHQQPHPCRVGVRPDPVAQVEHVVRAAAAEYLADVAAQGVLGAVQQPGVPVPLPMYPVTDWTLEIVPVIL